MALHPQRKQNKAGHFLWLNVQKELTSYEAELLEHSRFKNLFAKLNIIGESELTLKAHKMPLSPP